MSEQGREQATGASLGRTSTSTKVGGYLLIAFGIIGFLLGVAKLTTDFGSFDTDYFFGIVDSVAGLVAISAGWLALRAWTPAKILMPLALAIIAGVADVSAYAVYGLASQTGAIGIVYFVSAIPLLLTYKR